MTLNHAIFRQITCVFFKDDDIALSSRCYIPGLDLACSINGMHWMRSKALLKSFEYYFVCLLNTLHVFNIKYYRYASNQF